MLIASRSEITLDRLHVLNVTARVSYHISKSLPSPTMSGECREIVGMASKAVANAAGVSRDEGGQVNDRDGRQGGVGEPLIKCLLK